jgi:hypothetical protein
MIAMLVLPALAFADCPSELQGLEGWTIASATSVVGEFEGCDLDRVIRFSNGSRFRCATYSYTYSYSPDAIIFTKRVSYKGNNYALIKVLIEDELYDMSPIRVK